MSFYKQYPPIKDNFVHVLMRIILIIGLPGFLFYMAYNAHNLGNSSDAYVFIGVAVFVALLGFGASHFLIKGFKKRTYLMKHGTKKNVVCTKVEKYYSSGVSEDDPEKRITYTFSFTGTDGITHKVSTFPLTGNTHVTLETSDIGIHEGDQIPIIYNPEDPSDCILDEDKFKNK